MVEYRITPPALPAVLLADFKRHAKVTWNSEDEALSLKVGAATAWAETWTRRALVTQTWEVELDRFPPTQVGGLSEIPLPRGMLQSVESITYTDPEEVDQTLDPAVYTVQSNRDPGRVILAYGQAWPSTLDHPGSVRVRFLCGYGDDSAQVPEDLRNAIMLVAADLDANREMTITGTIVSEVPFSAKALLQPYRLLHL